MLQVAGELSCSEVPERTRKHCLELGMVHAPADPLDWIVDASDPPPSTPAFASGGTTGQCP